MKLECLGINDDGCVEQEFTCDGANVSPEIKWSETPPETKSFALYCHDPDAPMSGWVHWIVINIPADVENIPKGGPVPGVEVVNDFGRTSYGGPCPPSGTHRYYFILYALKADKLEGVTKDNFLEKVNAAKLAEASVIGKYQRK